MRVAGIMSGTSLDGIDVAIVDIAGQRFSTLAFESTPYPEAVRSALLGISNAETHTGVISRLNFLLGELYADAVLRTCARSGIPAASVQLIGCHGQTVFHEGSPVKFLGRSVSSTLQIGEASVIAERTGIPVVSNFRTRDMAAGGCGAPLVPYVDYYAFRHKTRGRIALNIGGIANLTAIPPGAAPDQVIAFDTGPGNMVIDALTAEFTGGRQKFDRGGRIAASGQVCRPMLDRLLADPYFTRKPPKTAGREQYGKEFVGGLVESGVPLGDLIATATAFTAAAIAQGITRFVGPRMRAHDLIVSGGGAHNPRILAYLSSFLPDVPVSTSTDFGIDVDAKEAIAFALLAYQTWRRRPANLPSATGAKRPVILGDLTP